MRLLRLLAAITVLSVAPLAPPASAQSTDNMVELKDGTGIDRDGATYRLTKQVVPRFAAALRQMAALRKSDPEIFAGAGKDAIPPKMQAIFGSSKITMEEYGKFFTAVFTAHMIGEVSDNSAAYPILHENIRFVKANAAAMKQINADIASFYQDMEIKK